MPKPSSSRAKARSSVIRHGFGSLRIRELAGSRVRCTSAFYAAVTIRSPRKTTPRTNVNSDPCVVTHRTDPRYGPLREATDSPRDESIPPAVLRAADGALGTPRFRLRTVDVGEAVFAGEFADGERCARFVHDVAVSGEGGHCTAQILRRLRHTELARGERDGRDPVRS